MHDNHDKEQDPLGFLEGMAELKPKDKEPSSVRVLNSWIAHAEQALGYPI